MTITTTILFLLVAVAGFGTGALAVRAYEMKQQLAKCENCRVLEDLGREMQADIDQVITEDRAAQIANAAFQAILPDQDYDSLAIQIPARSVPSVSSVAETLTEEPAAWVDLDVLGAIESGNDDTAIGAAGERGRYQITQDAWGDTLKWLQLSRGMRLSWKWELVAHDPDRARFIASTYVNEVLPAWLQVSRLFRADETGPMPDSLHARLAAYNCGAYRTRQAYAKLQAEGGVNTWIAHLPISTVGYLCKYQEAEAEARQKEKGKVQK